jgi:membrane protease YdiL (CAAX protease family)
MKKDNVLKVVGIFEIFLMFLIIILDVFIPTILAFGIGFLFLLLRKENFSTLGFKKEVHFLKMVFTVFILAAIWTIVDYTVLLPLLSHITGMSQDLSAFAKLKGNIGFLMTMLVANWTLAAFGEEIVYRGMIQNRITSIFINKKTGTIIAIAASSIIFGLAHTEQGIIGVLITMIDALFFSLVKYRYRNLWASILVHGFMNSIGMIVFYFTGPIYGLW